MPSRTRRLIPATLCALAAVAVTPATSGAATVPTLSAGAEIIGQPAGAGAMQINLIMGASFATDDGSALSAVRKVRVSFPSGAKYNGGLFKTCSAKKVEARTCPRGSKIGSGGAQANLGPGSDIQAEMAVYNGPGNANRRQVFLTSKVGGILLTFTGTMRRTGGKYGYVLDLSIPPILPALVDGGVALQSFETIVGAKTRVKGKTVPLVTAPTSCRKQWPFSAVFTFADGSTVTRNAAIPCRIMATPL